MVGKKKESEREIAGERAKAAEQEIRTKSKGKRVSNTHCASLNQMYRLYASNKTMAAWPRSVHNCSRYFNTVAHHPKQENTVEYIN